MNKSKKFRELLEEERYLQSKLGDCVTAQSRMLSEAFKSLGLKLGRIPEMCNDQSIIRVAETTDWSVRYYRDTGAQSTGAQIEAHEISLEDLFDSKLKRGKV